MCDSTGWEVIEAGPIFGIDYLHLYHCEWENHQFIFGLLFCALITGLIWTLGNTADNYLSPNLSKVCETLNLSYNVAGVTFLAFGNGAPDVFTQVAALSSLNVDTALLGFNTVLGSSMFVVTIVVGTVAILSPCHVSSKIFLRDVTFHITAVTMISVIAIAQKLTLIFGIFLFALYMSYVAVVLVVAERDARLALASTSSSNINNDTVRPKLMGHLGGTGTGGLVVRSLGSDLQTAFWHKSNDSTSTITSDSKSNDNKHVTKSVNTGAAAVAGGKTNKTVAEATAGGYTFLVLDEDDDTDSNSEEEEVSFGSSSGMGTVISTTKLKTKSGDKNHVDDGTITLSGGLLGSAGFDGEIQENYVDMNMANRDRERREHTYDIQYKRGASMAPNTGVISTNTNTPSWNQVQSGLTQGLLSNDTDYNYNDEETIDFGANTESGGYALISPSMFAAATTNSITNTNAAGASGAAALDMNNEYNEANRIGLSRIHAQQAQARSDSIMEALYWENRFLQTRIRKFEALEFWTLPLHSKIVACMAFPVYLLRDISIPTLQLESWYRPYAIAHPIAIGMVCLWTFQNWSLGAIVKTCIFGAFPAILIFLNTHTSKPPNNPLLVISWVLTAFFMCIVWMYLLCGELICCLETLGSILNIPSAYLGLTLLAWGNCVGDLFSISAIARRGLGEMAIAGCYGSPVFDILFGLGLSICLSTAKIYPEPFLLSLDSSSYISIAFLYITLISTIIIISYRGWRIEKGFGYYLYGVYFAYTIMQILLVVSD